VFIVARLSEAEWEIMKVLWLKSPRTANEVIEHLKNKTDWSPNTVRTMLNRLVKKEVISYHHRKNVYLYYPLVSKEDSLKIETKSFLKRIYGEPLKPLFVNFIQEEKLSPEDIDDLRRALDKKEQNV
jgi:BlaI family transcriptional regulator, penicillinase repressor